MDLIRSIRDRGLPVILISHNMPHVFEVADRIHVHRLGRRAAVVRPSDPVSYTHLDVYKRQVLARLRSYAA